MIIDPFFLFKLSVALFVTGIIFSILLYDRFASYYYKVAIEVITSILTYSALALFTLSLIIGVWFWVFDKL